MVEYMLNVGKALSLAQKLHAPLLRSISRGSRDIVQKGKSLALYEAAST